MDDFRVTCWNKLKEEITANEVFHVFRTGSIRPVNNVIKTKEYREQERERHGQDFSEVLAEERNKKSKGKEDKKPTTEKLCYMAGLNQYNRAAKEFCFVLSSKTDYKA